MVKGLDTFWKYFADYEERQETLINAVRMQNKDITVVRWC